jgi:hypothetical protein
MRAAGMHQRPRCSPLMLFLADGRSLLMGNRVGRYVLDFAWPACVPSHLLTDCAWQVR